MAIANGDYIEIESAVVEAIEADVGEGGLFETGAPAVAIVEAGLRNESRAYRDHELPALAVVVTDKQERRDSGATTRSFDIAVHVYCRGADRAEEGARARKIASRVEQLLRDENAPSRRLGDLPASLAWSLGTLDITPTRTEFRVGDETKRGQKKYSVSVIVEAIIEIPATVY